MNTLDNEDNIEKLAPSSIKKDETVRNAIKTTDCNLSKVHQHLNDAVFLYRINELSSEQLDHLAVQWQPLVWRDSWSIDTKRAVIATMIVEKRRMGTLSAVKNALASVKSASTVQEWWQQSPQGKPHTFKITVSQNKLGGIVREEMTRDLRLLIDITKPVRSQYTLTIIQALEGNLTLSAGKKSVVMCNVPIVQKLVCKARSTLSRTSKLKAFSYITVNDVNL
nr:MAG TPA: tail protein [Caudoviricetes sp.]